MGQEVGWGVGIPLPPQPLSLVNETAGHTNLLSQPCPQLQYSAPPLPKGKLPRRPEPPKGSSQLLHGARSAGSPYLLDPASPVTCHAPQGGVAHAGCAIPGVPPLSTLRIHSGLSRTTHETRDLKVDAVQRGYSNLC